MTKTSYFVSCFKDLAGIIHVREPKSGWNFPKESDWVQACPFSAEGCLESGGVAAAHDEGLWYLADVNAI